jgi:hypothetical protein
MRHLQLQKYLSLPQGGKVIAEYVWIDGSNGLRSKSKVSNFPHQFLLHTHIHDALRHLRHFRRSLGSFELLCCVSQLWLEDQHSSKPHRDARLRGACSNWGLYALLVLLCDLMRRRSPTFATGGCFLSR